MRHLKLMPLLCILTVAMLFTTIFIPTSSSGQNEGGAEAPDWQEGDQWVYDVDHRYGMGDLTLYVNNTPIEDDVIRVGEPDDENYTDYEVFKLDSEMRGKFGRTNESFQKRSINKTYFYEKETLDIVSRQAVNGTFYHFKPPWEKFDFPIKTGKTWTTNSSVLKSDGEKLGDQVFEYECTNKTQVSVPAGDYSTYRITRNRTLNDPIGEIDLVMYYSPEVENVVKIDFNDIEGQFQYSQELRSYDLASPPSAPQNLQATAGDNQVNLTWHPPSENGDIGITEYNIYRGENSGELSYYKTVNASSTSYIDHDVTDGQTYYYQISALNVAGEGEKTSEVSATPSADDDDDTGGGNGTPGFTFPILLIGVFLILKYRQKRNPGQS